jgi:plasmid stabilization system protein ParE
VPAGGFLTPAADEAEVPVARWMALQAELLVAAATRSDPRAGEILRFAGFEPGELDVDTARLAIARDHWYADWADGMAHGSDLVDTRFEAAADAVHDGDLDQLRRLLDEAPALVRQRSPFPHRQTLLHHVAANGIEVERQIHSPTNAVEVLRLLLERGAEPDAVCESYGGGNGATTLCLLVSSANPFVAGVQVGLVEEMTRGGARVDGIDGDGLPLWTAVMFGYTDAAEALARAGARVDNLCLAAALGDLDAVRGYFGADGRLRPDIPPLTRVGATGPALAPEHVVDYALIWAAAHGRRAVVEFLLTKDPDLTVREPVFHATALGAARHLGKSRIVALLAPLTPG